MGREGFKVVFLCSSAARNDSWSSFRRRSWIGDRSPIREPSPTRLESLERLIELSSWMMVLGTIRLVCAIADYATALLERSRLDPWSFRMLGRFIQENHPIVLLSAAWPLLLGVALRRTRWPELLRAAGVTFLILSIGGVLEMTAELSRDSRGRGHAWRLPSRALGFLPSHLRRT